MVREAGMVEKHSGCERERERGERLAKMLA